MNDINKEFGIVTLLDALGTRQRLLDYIDKFLVDWNLVLEKLDKNIKILENKLVGKGVKTSVETRNDRRDLPTVRTDLPRTCPLLASLRLHLRLQLD